MKPWQIILLILIIVAIIVVVISFLLGKNRQLTSSKKQKITQNDVRVIRIIRELSEIYKKVDSKTKK